MTANVQPNLSNSAGCVITASGVEGQKLGLVFYGIDNSGFTPATWGSGSTSFRCVKSPTQRIGSPLSAGGTFAQCDGVFVVDWDAFQLAEPTALGQPWTVGDKVFAQAWYRDPSAVKTSNLSNAVELTLVVTPPAPCVTPIDRMAFVPAGAFQMGSNAAGGPPYFGAWSPVHSVTITYCFWMGTREVTQAQYLAWMGSNPSLFSGADHPVENVSWHQARAYCAALTAHGASSGALPPGYEYRLPTEAEWEYACRAGAATEFNVGPALFCSDARFRYSQHSSSLCGVNSTTAVGTYAPNAWGLFDMHGNVSEWCLDSLSSYSSPPQVDPFVTGGPTRVVRGGDWWLNSERCRSADRNSYDPTTQNAHIGFRVVLGPALTP